MSYIPTDNSTEYNNHIHYNCSYCIFQNLNRSLVCHTYVCGIDFVCGMVEKGRLAGKCIFNCAFIFFVDNDRQLTPLYLEFYSAKCL